ncbi:MAG: CvpA family protein [Clostridia bacterium]|nr:CvpA family protein [Clostridia bacterium]
MADIIVILIVGLTAYVGSKRGLMRSLVGFASTFASLILGVILYHPVSKWLAGSQFGENISEAVNKYFESNPPMGEQEGIFSMLMGSEAVSEGAARIATMLFISAISFLLVAISSKLIIKIAIVMLNVGTKLPVIKQANALLGALVGALSGIVISYVCIGVVAAFEPSGAAPGLCEMIKNSNIAYLFYYDNGITGIMAAFIK